MANHDHLIPYESQVEEWLRSEGCCVPPAGTGSRFPTKDEVIAAIEEQGMHAHDDGSGYILVVPPEDAPAKVHDMTRTVKSIEFVEGQMREARPPMSYLVRLYSNQWEEGATPEKAFVTMRGNFPFELFLTHTLTRECGALLLYPDIGDPPVVVQPDADIGRIATLWLEVVRAGDTWAELYRRIAATQ